MRSKQPLSLFLEPQPSTYMMKRIVILSIIALIASFACGVFAASAKTSAGVDLAQLKDWDIVVADDAIASEVYADEECQEFFSQASS